MNAMKTIPPEAVSYKRTPDFTAVTLPAGLRRNHSTRSGVWGRIHVVEGRLRYRVLGHAPTEHLLSPDRPGVIEPEVPHEVEPVGDVRFYVEFLRSPVPA